ncbi:aldo/keto reductase [Phragmitibacter flavus]|uniref:Aldo/keto reductase n=1 Tax=Phragmitibacter flavus TaxID=2576071 RepID=A0A5R8KI97_9BACT|nr:aldo/keto reductase [Phragmitibacter flavus]TLD71970.1 aldo/keto reductase [Phragmitibacter flavus]
MTTRTLGKTGPTVSTLGLGCMGMTDHYGPADRTTSLATLHAAIDAGITLLDTADFYGAGHNELLLREILATTPREKLIISGKFGAMRDPSGGWGPIDARPAFMRHSLAQSLQRLNIDHIDIYRPVRLDPNVPIEETITALATMVKKGYIRHIGLSEVSADTIRRAHAIHPICDVQLEYSLLTRGAEDTIIPTCRELGIGITAYGTLSRGLLSGHFDPTALTPRDFRSVSPRFRAANLEKNLQLVESLRPLAEQHNATIAQLAIAWVLASGDDIIPIIGARTPTQLQEILGSLTLPLSWTDLPDIEQAIPKNAASGERYPLAMLRDMDSERPTPQG